MRQRAPSRGKERSTSGVECADQILLDHQAAESPFAWDLGRWPAALSPKNFHAMALGRRQAPPSDVHIALGCREGAVFRCVDRQFMQGQANALCGLGLELYFGPSTATCGETRER